MYSSTRFLVMREKSTIPSLSWRIRRGGIRNGASAQQEVESHLHGRGDARICSVQYQICIVLFCDTRSVVRMPFEG